MTQAHGQPISRSQIARHPGMFSGHQKQCTLAKLESANHRKHHLPIHQQVLLHPEAVCSAVASSGVPVGTSGVARLPGIVGVILVAVEVRQVPATLALRAGELSRLLPDTGCVNHQCVLERFMEKKKCKMG